jgi:predicted PurR-regulated permease PerM
MTQQKYTPYFLFICLIIALVLVGFIIKPFLSPLILAAIFAFLFQPVYRRFLGWFKQRESLAAFVTTICTIILIIIPLTLIGGRIFKESTHLYNTLASEGKDGFVMMVENTINQGRALLPIPNNFEIDFNQYLKQGLDKLVQNLGSIFSGLAVLFMDLVIFLMAFYFLLKDGYRLKDYFVILSPLEDKDDNIIVSRLKLSVSATVKGSLSIGLIQGILAGIGFAIFGLPNAVLWGSLTVIASLIPSVGTSLVMTPSVLFLFFTGNTFGAVGLLIWGVLAVGLIDNFLGPRLVSKGMQLHPLIVFLSVLGGLVFFGPLGFLLGPLSVSICLALIEIYFSLRNKGGKVTI